MSARGHRGRPPVERCPGPAAAGQGRTLLTAAEVAARLRPGSAGALDWFYRRKKGLIADHGFPPPVPGCGNRWDPAALDRWLDAQDPRAPKPAAAPAAPAAANDETDWTAILAARGQAIAAGRPLPGDE